MTFQEIPQTASKQAALLPPPWAASTCALPGSQGARAQPPPRGPGASLVRSSPPSPSTLRRLPWTGPSRRVLRGSPPPTTQLGGSVSPWRRQGVQQPLHNSHRCSPPGLLAHCPPGPAGHFSLPPPASGTRFASPHSHVTEVGASQPPRAP